MPSTFSQQLRYLRTHEPALYESISKVYRKCLMESNLAPDMATPDEEAAKTPVEKTEIKQTNTKGMDSLMDKVHAMVGVNENKKEGEDIFDTKDDDIETVKPDPQQQAELFGETPPAEGGDNGVPAATPPAEETPTEELPDMDLGNLFADEGTTEPATENTETEPPTEEPPAEPNAEPAQQPETEELGDLDYGNLF